MIVPLIKQNSFLFHVKAYTAVKADTVASHVAGDLSSFYLVALPSSTWWPKMATPAPALMSIFQSAEGEAGGGAGILLPPFKGTAQKLHTSRPFISH